MHEVLTGEAASTLRELASSWSAAQMQAAKAERQGEGGSSRRLSHSPSRSPSPSRADDFAPVAQPNVSPMPASPPRPPSSPLRGAPAATSSTVVPNHAASPFSSPPLKRRPLVASPSRPSTKISQLAGSELPPSVSGFVRQAAGTGAVPHESRSVYASSAANRQSPQRARGAFTSSSTPSSSSLPSSLQAPSALQLPAAAYAMSVRQDQIITASDTGSSGSNKIAVFGADSPRAVMSRAAETIALSLQSSPLASPTSFLASARLNRTGRSPAKMTGANGSRNNTPARAQSSRQELPSSVRVRSTGNGVDVESGAAWGGRDRRAMSVSSFDGEMRRLEASITAISHATSSPGQRS